MKTKKIKGFTLPEILTVMVIIAIMVSILMPALSKVKRLAKDVKQKAQIVSIEMGVTIYKNDFGEYPPSHGSNAPADSYSFSYCGAQTLAEAMFGQDMLGFHTESTYINEGKDNTIPNTSKLYIYPTMPDLDRTTSLSKRKEPYLDRTNISVFTPQDIFDKDTYSSVPGMVVSDRYVICDVFTAVNREINGKTYKVGTPVLYFRANPSAFNTQLIPYPITPTDHARNIYNWRDNYFLVGQGKITDGKEHPLCPIGTDMTKARSGERFYGFIGDPMIPNLNRPVRPESFLLISAGNDGLYGTKDDICNFDPNLPN